MIYVGFGFHKVIYKRVWFSLIIFSMLGKGINIFKKISFHRVESQIFEKSWLSFADFHKLGIALYF
jgi:hypothetical protein